MILMGRFDSLHRHQWSAGLYNQALSKGRPKAIRLKTADSGCVKAAGGQLP